MMTIRQFYLLKLTEECNEVGQRAAKQMQFGTYEKQANGPSSTKIDITNRDRLQGEVNDLLSVIQLLIVNEELPPGLGIPIDGTVFAAKRAKLAKYLKYSQELGEVEAGDAW